ncbi:MAG: hypothetical protein WBY53_19025 [Acidobacteriaceae bacterium]
MVLLVAVLGVASAAGQSAADGSIHGNVYSNRYFKISLTLPPNLHAVDLASLNVRRPPGNNEFLMLAAREGNAPAGIVLFAEKLNAGPSPVADGQEFLQRVRKTWDAGQVLDSQEVKVQKGGPTFEELDYEIPKVEFDSAIVTQVGDYLLVFKCNASSREDLKKMEDVVMAMRRE